MNRKFLINNPVFATVALVAAIGLFVLGWQHLQTSDSEAPFLNEDEDKGEMSLEEKFVARYYEVTLPGVEPITDIPEITGDEAADAHIRQLAEDRGYRLQFRPTRQLVEVEGEELQPETAAAWQELQAAAAEEEVNIVLVSGHRPVSTQRIIFDSQLRQRAIELQEAPFTAQQIVSGEADEIIDDILREYSPPGYSKHHSGHTIDVNDGDDTRNLTEFGETAAFRWLSENDYSNARRFGFLPSYPEGVDNLGPDPEAWEFVWVGVENTEF